MTGNKVTSASCSDSESPTEPLTQRLAAILRSKCGVSARNSEDEPYWGETFIRYLYIHPYLLFIPKTIFLYLSASSMRKKVYTSFAQLVAASVIRFTNLETVPISIQVFPRIKLVLDL